MSYFETLLITCLFSFSLITKAQVVDDFSDGDFTGSPAWQGDLAHFMVNNSLQLQLNAPAAGTSFISTPVSVFDSTVWEVYFKMDFAPSTSNNLWIVLQSDQADLSSGNGYYLYVGETGSEDAVQFYRMDAGVGTLLASGTLAAVANGADARLYMERRVGGQWTLWIDYAGGQNFTQEFSIVDNTFGIGDYHFGFICEYTATRVDKFFFDDILVAPIVPDSDPPLLLSATAISTTELDVWFNEPLDELSATDPSTYNIDNGIGEPAAAFLDAQDQTLVHLSLQDPLVSMTDYVLTVNGIADLNGNASGVQTASFSFVEIATADEFDILINEIMADPSPVVTLPEIEFIELYNRSDKVLNLEGFTLSSGSTPQHFPAFVLMPQGYVLVCDDAHVDSLTPYGAVIGLGSFPGLTNTNDELVLADPLGNVVHQINYSLSTYRDSQKEEGGWTLELVNPSVPCKGESNWRASNSLLGGTPGQANSVLSELPDLDGPNLVRAFAESSQLYLIDLFFDEVLEPLAAASKGNYSISGNMEVFSVELLPSGEVVRLLLTAPLELGVFYEISVSDEVTDCSGNGILQKMTTLALPSLIEPLDIVINEILFNPMTGGVDFVEIFNRSDKVLNTGDLIIGNIQEGIDTVVRDVKTNKLLFPGEYVVFTSLPDDIKMRYNVQQEAALIANELPAFNNDFGNVTIFKGGANGAVVIDAFDYSEDFHHPLLDDADGVSLERLSAEAPTLSPSNWQSAAATAGYATPTYKNSQSLQVPNQASGFFDLPEKKLSPDGDGFQDFLTINYKLDKPGYTVQAKIFDAEGRQVKTLLNNELLATEGFFRWDGDTDRGDKARIGIYILWVQVFHPDGTVKDFKETCVVAGRL